MVFHISDLVQLAALDYRVIEHVDHGLRSALDPSIPTSIGRVTSRPRPRRSTSGSVTSVAFSVEPSTSASGCLTPSMPIPRATTQQDSAKCTPSIINATKSSPHRSADSSPARAVSVIATKRRETADLLVAENVSLTRPTGSRPTAY